MKFPKAYCEEIEDTISPYKARDCYFDETNKFYQQKLTFLCPDPKCRQEITSVGVYLERKSKRVLHFRGLKNKEHHEKCTFLVDKQSGKRRSGDSEYSLSIDGQIPSEFILNNKKFPPLKRLNDQQKNDIDLSTHSSCSSSGDDNDTHKEYDNKTSSFENIVDVFREADIETLKKAQLTINDKTRSYKSWFKNIKFHMDGKGLIYWGTVKEIKSYGNDFAIKFKEHVWYKDGWKPVSIYLTDEQINKYYKKNLFRSNLEGLKEENKSILCFFTGAYPKLKEVEYENGSFVAFEVKIKNLNHICFEFQ